MQKVFTAANPEQASLIKQMLEDAGIQAVVQGSPLWSVVGDLAPWTIPPTIWVGSDEDAQRASAIINEHVAPLAPPRYCETCGYDLTGLPNPRCPECGQPFFRPPPRPEPRSSWKCPTCGQPMEGQFTACWKCGHEQPADTTGTIET